MSNHFLITFQFFVKTKNTICGNGDYLLTTSAIFPNREEEENKLKDDLSEKYSCSREYIQIVFVNILSLTNAEYQEWNRTKGKRKGTIYTFINKKNETVRAVAFDDEQESNFSDFGKVFLRILDNENNLKKTDKGESIVSVKNKNELTKESDWN